MRSGGKNFKTNSLGHPVYPHAVAPELSVGVSTTYRSFKDSFEQFAPQIAQLLSRLGLLQQINLLTIRGDEDVTKMICGDCFTPPIGSG